MARRTFAKSYRSSHGLVIGIDHHLKASPLGCAVADARAVAEALASVFGFPASQVRLVLNAEATKAAIMREFMRLATPAVESEDRIVVFFAGHGHTLTTPAGDDVGFLVPHDGDASDLSSLIRWDDLTKNAGLVHAKHILFFMDACYGGLALNRSLKPGSMRFLGDMLSRHSRQVLTAGKADETVADSGGPRRGHSPFTGYLLDALHGQAADTEGLITASGVMNYVYNAVSKDGDVRQTPHYGSFDGDGDLILSSPHLRVGPNAATAVDEDENDVLVVVPSPFLSTEESNVTVVGRTKEYLGDDRLRILLNETVAEEVRRVIGLTSVDQFANTTEWSDAEFNRRIIEYQELLSPLCRVMALLGWWGTPHHREILAMPLKRLADRFGAQSGNTGWLSLRWYPALLLMYAGGVAAVAAQKYDNLAAILFARVRTSERHSDRWQPFVQSITESISFPMYKMFNKLPNLDRRQTPLSDHLHSVLQPVMDDMLFLGSDYEDAFDRFEVFCSFEYECRGGRAPIGRFGWKSEYPERSPMHDVVREAKDAGLAWAPFNAGLFGGSLEAFLGVSKSVPERIRTSGMFW
jgi:hypothetical protein